MTYLNTSSNNGSEINQVLILRDRDSGFYMSPCRLGLSTTGNTPNRMKTVSAG